MQHVKIGGGGGGRGLTLIGKIQIVKYFAILEIIFKAALTFLPSELIKEKKQRTLV